MMAYQTFSLHTSNEIDDIPWLWTEINLLLRRKLGENIEIYDKWCHPTDKRFAVVFLNTSLSKEDLQLALRDVKGCTVEKVKETSSILVSGGDSKITDLEDELCLLFCWKKNGGSPVKDVKKLPNGEFEVTFERWDAVVEACKHCWTLNEVDLKVVPYFDCFIDIVREASPQKTYNDVTEIRKEYIRRFYPQKSHGGSNLTKEKFQNDIDNCGKYYDWSLPLPGVKEYLKGDGRKMMRKIEDEYKCIFDLKQSAVKEKENKSSNFTVTLLGSVSVTKHVTVHLVQGHASKIKADGYLHINKEMYRPEELQEERDLDCKLQEVCNSGKLVISVSSMLSKDLQLDVFAEMILRKITGISKGKSKIHVFLCEADNDALLEAYKYTLLTEKDKHNLDPVDVEIWNSISDQGSSIQEFAYLKNKVEVVESLPSNFNTPAPVFVCVPIAQSLEPSTCPESLLKYDDEWRKALKNVSSNMKEDEISQFIVGATYKLKIPRSQDTIYVYLYCTQDWGFGVSKAIAQSLQSCLEVGRDCNNPELYIFPPGTYGIESKRYPVEFTVQRCLRELAKRRDMMEKYNSVKLVVDNQQFYQAFKKCLRKEKIGWSDFFLGLLPFSYSLKPESSIAIYGKKQACETAYKKLKKHLDERIFEFTFERNINPKDTESIKQKISSESLQNVHVEITKGTLKCSGLSHKAIKEFESRICHFFLKPKSRDQAERPNSSSNEEAISLLKKCCEKSRIMITQDYKLNNDRRKEEFERKTPSTQIHKSFWHRMRYDVYAKKEDHRFDKKNSLLVKGKDKHPLCFDKDPSKLLTSGRFDLKSGHDACLLLCDVKLKCSKSAKKDGQIKLQYDECDNEQIFPRLVAIVKK